MTPAEKPKAEERNFLLSDFDKKTITAPSMVARPAKAELKNAIATLDILLLLLFLFAGSTGRMTNVHYFTIFAIKKRPATVLP